MYGVVLLMAVTAGGESADLGRRGHGCCGVVSHGCCGVVSSCHGCRGVVTHSCCGYVSSCHGCRGVVSHGCCGVVSHGCCGVVSHGCCGVVSHGCCGVVSHGCCGVVSHGCCGVSHGCCGTVVPSGHGKKVAAASPNAATVVVTLPADAKLTVDGDATVSTSSERTFETPELVAGKTYAYTLEATFQQDGKAVVVSKKIKIEAGKTATVDLNSTPVTGVARN